MKHIVKHLYSVDISSSTHSPTMLHALDSNLPLINSVFGAELCMILTKMHQEDLQHQGFHVEALSRSCWQCPCCSRCPKTPRAGVSRAQCWERRSLCCVPIMRRINLGSTGPRHQMTPSPRLTRHPAACK